MKKVTKTYIILILIVVGFNVKAQNKYIYNVDVTNVVNDRVKVELTTPVINKYEIQFFVPRIIPGTYRIADYGRYIHDLVAYDKNGDKLDVERTDTNSWKISNAKKLKRVAYWVEDTFDSDLDDPEIFGPAGTNIEDGRNFVINSAGFFGYFDGMKDLAYTVIIKRDQDMYGASGLHSKTKDNSVDTFSTENYYDLIDSPIMYTSQADTSLIYIANTEVLISCYSPNNVIASGEIKATIEEILIAQKEYMGGGLPVDKYAFLFYFDPNPADGTGALEHSYSSLYVSKEAPVNQMKQWLRDVCAHEFFHIITPLNIHSEEIHEFNYNEPEMSRHLWLYEGVTEYFAGNMQVKGKIITRNQYLNELRDKMIESESLYRNDMSFTKLSINILENHSEFTNVYRKGALIALCLDLKLRELSRGEYGVQNLVRDLSKRFGKYKPFKDEELFGIIESMTYPEIGEFFEKYVIKNNPLPFEEVFALAGLEYLREKEDLKYSLGFTDESIGFNPSIGQFFIADVDALDSFGKTLGYKQGDALLQIQEMPTPDPSEIGSYIQRIRSSLKEGDDYSVKVLRKNDDGSEEELVLTSKVSKIKYKKRHNMRFEEDISDKQRIIRESWLSASSIERKAEKQGSGLENRIDLLLRMEIDLIKIPGGSFFMGGNSKMNRSPEKPKHQVSLKSFAMARTEITFDQYDFYCEATGKSKPTDSGWGRGERPVINVKHTDAINFCKWLSEETGEKYRLPTEAEWEYAARDQGKEKMFGNNTSIADPSEMNFDGRKEKKEKYSVVGEYLGRTLPVASFRPNELGLYDMSGNVYEWCQDVYDGGYYKQSASENPTGPAASEAELQYRVIRGGSWGTTPTGIRCNSRGSFLPNESLNQIGFRIVKEE